MIELALIAGLGFTAWYITFIAGKIEEESNIINHGIYIGSTLFLVLLMVTGWGIAEESAYEIAEYSYLVGTFLVGLAWIAYVAKLLGVARSQTQEDSALEGFKAR